MQIITVDFVAKHTSYLSVTWQLVTCQRATSEDACGSEGTLAAAATIFFNISKNMHKRRRRGA